MDMDQKQYGGPGGMVVEERGHGPRVVFVHGGGIGGAMAWQAQWSLADAWRLVMPARPGYGSSPWLGNEDFERDADYIADLIEAGDHIVAHSYGAAVAMLAVARDVSRVASLTLIESGTSAVAKDDPRVCAFHYACLGLAAYPQQTTKRIGEHCSESSNRRNRCQTHCLIRRDPSRLTCDTSGRRRKP